jgi:hypothetical protein
MVMAMATQLPKQTTEQVPLSRLSSQDLAGYEDGMNMYQYVHGNPVTASNPTGLASEAPLMDAAKMYLNRVLEIKFPPLQSAPHPTTAGPMPLVGGILWGLARAYADKDKELTPELLAKRAAEFATPTAITYSAMAYYMMTGSKTAFEVARLGGLFSRAGLYAAAFYAGFQIGNKWIAGPIQDLGNEAWFYKNKRDALVAIKSEGELLAGLMLKDAPNVLFGEKEYQLSATFPPKSANAMIRYFGLASYSYGLKVWDSTVGATYEDFKAKVKGGGRTEEDPRFLKQLFLDYEDAIKKYADSVAMELQGQPSTP